MNIQEAIAKLFEFCYWCWWIQLICLSVGAAILVAAAISFCNDWRKM